MAGATRVVPSCCVLIVRRGKFAGTATAPRRWECLTFLRCPKNVTEAVSHAPDGPKGRGGTMERWIVPALRDEPQSPRRQMLGTSGAAQVLARLKRGARLVAFGVAVATTPCVGQVEVTGYGGSYSPTAYVMSGAGFVCTAGEVSGSN